METKDWIIIVLVIGIAVLAFRRGHGMGFFCERCAKVCGTTTPTTAGRRRSAQGNCPMPFMDNIEGYAPQYTRPIVTGYSEGMGTTEPSKIITQDMASQGDLNYDAMLYR